MDHLMAEYELNQSLANSRPHSSLWVMGSWFVASLTVAGFMYWLVGVPFLSGIPMLWRWIGSLLFGVLMVSIAAIRCERRTRFGFRRSFEHIFNVTLAIRGSPSDVRSACIEAIERDCIFSITHNRSYLIAESRGCRLARTQLRAYILAGETDGQTAVHFSASPVLIWGGVWGNVEHVTRLESVISNLSNSPVARQLHVLSESHYE